MNNPLLRHDTLPSFSQIRPEHVLPALEEILADNRKKIEEILSKTSTYTWSNVIEALTTLDDRLNHMWSPVSHLNAVMNNDELRDVYKQCLPKLSEYSTELGQNKQLYAAYVAIAESPAYAELDTAQHKAIENALRDFRLSGIALPSDQQKRYQELSKRLSELSSQFSDNVLDATNEWFYLVTDHDDLKGLPEHAVTMAQEVAQQRNEQGWLFTLDYPSYLPVMMYSENRMLREILHTAFVTRASDQGPDAGRWDNTSIMQEILQLRHEIAQLLGFKHYADYSLATKMAESPEQVLGFLEELAQHSLPMAKQEFAELQAFATEYHGIENLQAWDIAFYSEKLRQHTYAISQEDLRPYFPINRVLEGMFTVIERLYGMKVTELSGVDVWHDDVRFFGITDAKGCLRGQFYLDLYARASKRGGAWMDECRVRRCLDNGAVQIPVAYLVCNFSPATQDKPALLTHDDVMTLFHEFGHGLHHMLTKVDYADVSGINGVAWDAVELPSQFMENWCWEKEALAFISGHYETDVTLPDDLLDKMQRAKNFQAGMQMLRQIEFSLFDFRIHSEYDKDKGIDVQAILDDVRTRYSVAPTLNCNRFQHGFTHIFAGGYAAGYYSYKWAEVLASDAFSKFEEDGIFNAETGQAFLESVLQKGGSKEAMELFKDFRGREPNVEALLRHSGITID